MDETELRRLVQDEAMQLPDMNLVVSGLAGRFPSSDSVAEFEANLYEGRDMINDQDNSRFSCGLWGLPPRAGRLKDLSRFDSEFFGFTPAEANFVDFQLRILYEVVYESILDAGVNPSALRGTNTGVFFGLHCNEFENAMADHPNFKTNGYYAQYAVKVAQYFDLRGITVTFDAACASGFVGLHSAVESLNNGLIEQAIVCSCNIPIHPTGSFIFLQMQMLSPTGYSRFLDSRADGYVKSEACVSVLLQRKPLALRNYASIMSTMTSVDGYKREGITFPSDKSQERLISQAKELAGVSTNHIEYLEAHGTGTPAGDPQEARAISNVYFPSEGNERLRIHSESGESPADLLDSGGRGRGEEREVDRRVIGPLLVGSVKTNMGHSEAASGLCALAKVVLMLENELIYKGLHYEKPNSNIEALMDGKLKFIEETTPLKGKIIPLSCYGFGGANVHAIVRANERPAIVDQADGDEQRGQRDSARLILMFGRSEEALNELFDNILDKQQLRGTRHCLTDDFLMLLDSLNAHTIDRMMNYRGYLIVDRGTKCELARGIRRCDLSPKSELDSLLDMGRREHLQDCKERRCHLVLPGLGSQWPQMGAGLREFKPFWDTIQRLSSILKPVMIDLELEQLLGSTGVEAALEKSMAAKFVSITGYQIALINIIRNQLRVKNLGSIVGHSLGEISAAYACGLMDERETILVAYRLGKTLDDNLDLVGGKMVAVVGLSLGEMEHLLERIRQQNPSCQLQVCCLNASNSLTISGRRHEVDSLCEQFRLREDSVFFKVVEDSVALHNQLIMGQEMRNKLKVAVEMVLFAGRTDLERPNGWISSVDDEIWANNKQANADYFADSLCRRVNFSSAIDRLEGDSICLEVGPSAPFEMQIRQMEALGLHHAKLMRSSISEADQKLYLLKQVGELYQLGARMNLIQFYHGFERPQEPVRRQTPSLSSLFKWQHQQQLFVPRYPVQFSKSSAKCEMPVDIVQDRDKYLTDHCIEGRVLFPATGYLFLIWRVFSFAQRKIFDACFHDVEHELVPIEFRDVRLLRAVILGNRSAQIYIHLEEGTGRFEIKEGGSVVVEGYACSPTENPTGLLHEDVRRRIKSERLEVSLSLDDVYKQFRVSGYDYGPLFRNIESASADGRYCRVRYNGHFVALTDSILQSIFLAIAQYAPSGGLFLPTCFEYVRFQPDVILNKIREAKMKFDLTDGSLNTKEKRDIMTKIMQREAGAKLDGAAAAAEEPTQREEEQQPAQQDQQPTEEKPECFFETFCDPVTGIIITDGIEMRGIKASPAPRRADNNNDALLESYQFVCDTEQPIDDENLTQFRHTIGVYTKVCDSMSMRVLEKLQRRQAADNQVKQMRVEEYMKVHKLLGPREEDYEIKKNGDKMLLSVLNELLHDTGDRSWREQAKRLRELVQKHRFHLMKDLIQSTFTSERLMRPLIETVVENCCTKRRKLKLLEINPDDGILRDPLVNLIQSIEPGLSVDYALAHPDPSRLSTNKIINNNSTTGGSTGGVRTYAMRDLQSLCSEQNLKDLDAIVYKDISCYSLPKQVIEQNGLSPVLSSLNGAIKLGGYVLLVMRKELTLAERVLLALSEPELVGLSKRNLAEMQQQMASLSSDSTIMKRIDHINSILQTRFKQMLREAERNRMICVGNKSDPNGCCVLVFRSTSKPDSSSSSSTEQNSTVEGQSGTEVERILLRVSHQDNATIAGWLGRLKECFKQQDEKKQEEEEEEEKGGEKHTQRRRKIVWLCSVATGEQPISGLIGMMQALRKELGSDSLRCYYDEFTFKNSQEPVSEAQIEACAKFQLSLRRDQIWNCIDGRGNFGSFRHFTINAYMSYESCRCDNGGCFALSNCTTADEVSRTKETVDVEKRKAAAYVNCAVRGDLSSFTWYEAPFAYLNKEERRDVVQVAYSALNFRDIMLATGRLPLDAVPMRLAMSDCLLGLEFAGLTEDGERVAGMISSRGIATHALCAGSNSLKLEIPDWISLRDAATIPVVYSTAIMALIYRGQMQRGESVLIHAGSGGVGQAAIRLAAHWGATIFTTVGSDEKRQFLLQEFADCLSDERIFSSRDCDFEWKIMEATRGRGVDLVLNSLADDKLQASVRCLADGGRFLEIGKYDMSTNARLELLRLETNKTFHGILLDKMFDRDDHGGPAFERQLRGIGQTLEEGLWQGYIKPIKSTVFESHQIEEAFRFMATGKHIGKVLIEIDGRLDTVADTPTTHVDGPSQVAHPKIPCACVPRFQLSPEKSYIVTGGLGGFGLELVKWLVGQGGARNVLLTSRQGLKTGYQRAALARLQANNGARFLIVTEAMADTTTAKGVEQLYEMALEMSPTSAVGGIFHLAMVLKDSLLDNMQPEDFEAVCRPKVETCQHLDELSRGMQLKLDYFVCFSSITSGKGNAGQSNYAYANSCLERICERRRHEHGEHGLAIQWGAIGDVGVAFENLGGNNVVIGGTIPQRMPSCLASLSRLLCGPFATCLSVLPVSRRSQDTAGEKGDLVGAIMHVLGIKDPSKVSEKANLGELGLDSLMAVEIRQYIEREYDMTLNIQEIRSLTIEKIREISEKEPANVKAAKQQRQQQQQQDKQVGESSQVTENEQQQQEQQSNAEPQIQGYGGAAKAALENKLANEAIEAMLDKSMVASFVPQLKLPKSDYRRLNYVFYRPPTSSGTRNGLVDSSSRGAAGLKPNGFGHSNGQTTSGNEDHNSRPIFFIPPIHGEFNQLEMICADIERPCIGLNWTRNLGRAESVDEACDIYLSLLASANWREEFCLPGGSSHNSQPAGDERLAVDLVGYSYGATIAFEMMLMLHADGGRKFPNLQAGNLILLDGSPKQIELGSQYLSNLTRKKPLDSNEKLDELLMVYLLAHTRRRKVDYVSFQQTLANTIRVEEKVKLASERLFQYVDSRYNSAGEIADAMEAFCRRYELVSRYKTSSSLPTGCTLIRAEQIYLTASLEEQKKFNEDLGLSSVVEGKVDLFVMKGNHETFLEENRRQISRIIAKHSGTH